MTSKKKTTKKARRVYMAGPEAIQKVEELEAQLAGSRKNVDSWMERAGQAERSLTEARELLVAEERNNRALKLDIADARRLLKEEKERGTKIAANFQEAARARDEFKRCEGLALEELGPPPKQIGGLLPYLDLASRIHALKAELREENNRKDGTVRALESQVEARESKIKSLEAELTKANHIASGFVEVAGAPIRQKLEADLAATREALTTAERDCSNYSKAASDWKRRFEGLAVLQVAHENLVEAFQAGEQHRRELQSKISRQKAELERLYVDQIDLRGKVQELRKNPKMIRVVPDERLEIHPGPGVISTAMIETRLLREKRDKFQAEVVVLEKIVDTLRQRIGEAVGHHAGHPILTVPECIARLAYVRDERTRLQRERDHLLNLHRDSETRIRQLVERRNHLKAQLNRIREASK